MVQIDKNVREVFEEALAIGQAHDKEKSRHSRANEKLMARAAENVYAAHLLDLVRSDGFAPSHAGEAGRQEVKEAALKGTPLTAKAYALLIGYSEAYISRLYRLGFGMAAGVLDPNEKPEPGEKTRWQQVSRAVGDTPEIAAVLGKEVEVLPDAERLDAAIQAAVERKAAERQEAAALAEEVAETETWVPDKPTDQIATLVEISEVVTHNPAVRRLSLKQITHVREVVDSLVALIEEWQAAHTERPEVPAEAEAPRRRGRPRKAAVA